jgi:hypothetical protein
MDRMHSGIDQRGDGGVDDRALILGLAQQQAASTVIAADGIPRALAQHKV